MRSTLHRFLTFKLTSRPHYRLLNRSTSPEPRPLHPSQLKTRTRRWRKTQPTRSPRSRSKTTPLRTKAKARLITKMGPRLSQMTMSPMKLLMKTNKTRTTANPMTTKKPTRGTRKANARATMAIRTTRTKKMVRTKTTTATRATRPRCQPRSLMPFSSLPLRSCRPWKCQFRKVHSMRRPVRASRNVQTECHLLEQVTRCTPRPKSKVKTEQ